MVGEAERDKVVLRDGVFVHEADAICQELERASVPLLCHRCRRKTRG